MSLPDSIYANPGDYTWSWGFSYQYPDPYTGACDVYNFSISLPVKIRLSTTYYTTPNPTYPDASGYCYYYQDACINNSNASIDEVSLNGNYQYNAGACSSLCPAPCPQYVYQNYGYVSVNGSIRYWVRFGSGLGGPGSCS